MNAEPFVVRPQDYPPALSVVGVDVTVLASNAVTGGYELTLQEGVPGAGPPQHRHDWDESFFVIRGSVHFNYAGKTALAAAGTLVHLPAGTVHGFHFGDEGGALLEMTAAGGGATAMFAQVSKLTGVAPPEPAELLGVFAANGVTFPA